MEEKAVVNNLRRSFSVANNNSNSTIATANGSLRNSSNYLYGGGTMKSYHHNWHQSRLYGNTPMLGSYDQFYEALRLYPSLSQPPLLPLPFSSNINSVALPLLPVKKKKVKPSSSKNNIKKKKKKKTAKTPTTKELAADRYKEEEEEEEEFFLSPPPSSLPLPRLLLMARPKAASCFAEADTGATNDLRRLLRL